MQRDAHIKSEFLALVQRMESQYNVNVSVKLTIGNRNFLRYIDKACSFFGRKRSDYYGNGRTKRPTNITEEHTAIIGWCTRYLLGTGPSYLGRVFELNHASILHLANRHDSLMDSFDSRYCPMYHKLEHHMNFTMPVNYHISVEETIS